MLLLGAAGAAVQRTLPASLLLDSMAEALTTYNATEAAYAVPVSGTGSNGVSVEARLVAAMDTIRHALPAGATIADLHDLMIADQDAGVRVVGRRTPQDQLTPAATWASGRTGVSVSGEDITLSSTFDDTISDVDFTGYRFVYTSGATKVRFVNCEIGGGGVVGGGLDSLFDPGANSQTWMFWCNLKGNFEEVGPSKLILRRSGGSTGFFRMIGCDIFGHNSDGFKMRNGDWCLFNRFDATAVTADTLIAYVPGTYEIGDKVCQAGENPLYSPFIYTCNTAGNTLAPLNKASGNGWTYSNPHGDSIGIHEACTAYTPIIGNVINTDPLRRWHPTTRNSNGHNSFIWYQTGGVDMSGVKVIGNYCQRNTFNGGNGFGQLNDAEVLYNRIETKQQVLGGQWTNPPASGFSTFSQGNTDPANGEAPLTSADYTAVTDRPVENGDTLLARDDFTLPELFATAWGGAGTISGGVWATTIDAQTSFPLRAQARDAAVPGAVLTRTERQYPYMDPRQMTGLHVFAMMGQSNIEWLVARSGPFLDPANSYPATIARENVRIVLGDGATEVIDDFLVTSSVMAAKNLNLGTAAMAEFLAARYPSAEFILLDLAVSGTPRTALQNDANTTRQWSKFDALISHVLTNYGKRPSLIFEFWNAGDSAYMPQFGRNFAPLYFGEMWSGAPFTLGGQNTESDPAYTTPVDHCIWDKTAATVDDLGRGIVTRAGTKWAVSPGPGGGANFEDRIGAVSAGRAFLEDARVIPFRQSAVTFPGLVGGKHSGGHPDPINDGQDKIAQGMVMPAFMKHTGDFIKPPAAIGYQMAGDYSYCDILVDLPHGGDLTTIGALEGRAALDSSILNRQDVYGIHLLRKADVPVGSNQANGGLPIYNVAETGQPVAYRGTVTIQDSGTGTAPNRTGKIRVALTNPFEDGDMLYVMADDNPVPGDASGQSTNESPLMPWTRFPIEHVSKFYDPTAGFPFCGFLPEREPMPHIIGSTAPSAPADYWTQVAGGPRFTDPNNLPAGCFRLKYSARLRLTDAGRMKAVPEGARTMLFQGGSYLVLTMRPDVANLYIQLGDLLDSAGTDLLSGGDIAILRPFPLNEWFDFSVDINMATALVNIDVNGVQISSTAIAAGTGLFATAANRRISFNGNGTGSMNQAVDFDFVQIETATTGGLTTRKLLSGPAATVNADGWKVVGSGDAI